MRSTNSRYLTTSEDFEKVVRFFNTNTYKPFCLKYSWKSRYLIKSRKTKTKLKCLPSSRRVSFIKFNNFNSCLAFFFLSFSTDSLIICSFFLQFFCGKKFERHFKITDAWHDVTLAVISEPMFTQEMAPLSALVRVSPG